MSACWGQRFFLHAAACDCAPMGKGNPAWSTENCLCNLMLDSRPFLRPKTPTDPPLALIDGSEPLSLVEPDDGLNRGNLAPLYDDIDSLSNK